MAPAVVHAATYSSKALIENAKLLDGKRVTYRGEAVTAIMKRGEFAWVNINDGDNAIGVWSPYGALRGVVSLGGYKRVGDALEVEGIFNRACNMHGGELDIHADKVKILKAGFAVRESVQGWKLGAAAFLFIMVLIVAIAFRRRI